MARSDNARSELAVRIDRLRHFHAGAAALSFALWLAVPLILSWQSRGQFSIFQLTAILIGAIESIYSLILLLRIPSSLTLAAKIDRLMNSGSQIQSAVLLSNGESSDSRGQHPVGIVLSRMSIERAGQLVAAVSKRHIWPTKAPIIAVTALAIAIGFSASQAAPSSAKLTRHRLAMSHLPFTFGHSHPRSPRWDISKANSGSVSPAQSDDSSRYSNNSKNGGNAPRSNSQIEGPLTPQSPKEYSQSPANPDVQNNEPGSGDEANAEMPHVQQVRCRITPPSSSNRPTYEGVMPTEGITAAPGTTIAISAICTGPVGGGTISYTPTQSTDPRSGMMFNPDVEPLALAGDGSNQVSGSFVVGSSGRLVLQITDVMGEPLPDAISSDVTITRDLPPTIRIMQPTGSIFADPDATITLVVLAEDEVGLSRVSLWRSLNSVIAPPLVIPLSSPAPTHYPMRITIKLSDWKLTDGDVVKLWFRADDASSAAPQHTHSAPLTVYIISSEPHSFGPRAEATTPQIAIPVVWMH